MLMELFLKFSGVRHCFLAFIHETALGSFCNYLDGLTAFILDISVIIISGFILDINW